jgi:SAM-dependent methyltransferase
MTCPPPRWLTGRPAWHALRRRPTAPQRWATRAAVPAAAAALLLAATAPALAQPGGLPLLSEEVPFITTPDAVTLAMLRAAGTARGDHVIDLGSGDGRIVITAARRFGATGLGVEIVPHLVQRSRVAAQRAGVEQQVRFAEQDLFETDLSPATVVTMYLLPEFNLRLRPRLLALKPGTRIVSHDWDMGDWLPDRTETLDVPDKPVGREKLSRVHLWWVPARVEGHWCGPQGQRLELVQQYQLLSGTWVLPRPAASGSGSGSASAAPADSEGEQRHPLTGRLRGDRVELLGLAWRLQGRALPAAGGVPGGLRLEVAAGDARGTTVLLNPAPAPGARCGGAP